MKIITRYFAYSAKKSAVQICLTIVLPLVIPYIFAAIIQIFTAAPPEPSTTSFDMLALPRPKDFPDYGSEFQYFSYSGSGEMSSKLIEHLISENSLGPDARVLRFSTYEQADKYFAASNIGQQYAALNLTDAREKFLYDLKNNFKYSGEVGHLFLDDLKSTYKDIYGLSDEDFEPQEQRNTIFLHLNILESNETIDGVPQNITVHMVYNTTVLDNLLKSGLDPISEQFGNIAMQPYWTGYALTLYKQIDEFLVKEYAGVAYQISFEQLNEIPNEALQISNIMLFEMSVLFAWAIYMIFATLIASYNRADHHVVLRRLGVTEGMFWVVNGVYVLVVMLCTVFLQVTVWHYTGVLPFGGMSIGFCLFEALVLSLQFTFIACLFSVFLGMSKTAPVLTSCILSFIFLFLPSMFHAGFFNSQTLFDPSLVPQWGTWLSMSICPLFGIFGLMDSMTSGLNTTLATGMFNDYKWRQADDLTPIAYLFTDYKSYTSRQHICLVSDSKNGQTSILGQCIYYQPLYGYVVLLNAIQIVLMPLLTYYVAYTKREKANRGLPLAFLWKKKFWQSSKIKPMENTAEAIKMRNVCVIFSKYEKKSSQKRSERQKLFFRKNFVLYGMNVSLQQKQICSLVGESNQGKSTILNVLAGEISPTDVHGFLRQHRFKKCDYGRVETFEDATSGNSRDQMLSWLDDLDAPECTLFETIDMLDPYNAYFIKPYIGYCPQDFSNVWMTMSVYRNVQFSLRMRMAATRDSIENEEYYIQDILQKAGLGDTNVQLRAASRLSGGMLRRLAFCNALVGSRHLLLLDEISAGVDPVIKRQIWEILRFVRGTVLLTSHDMAEIGEMTQSITVINNGHSVVDNVNQFELRKRYNQFSINLYKGKSMVTYVDFETLYQAVAREMQLQVAQQHILQAKIVQPLSTAELLSVCDTLDGFIKRYRFDDYNVDKCSLSDIYVDLIGYKQQKIQSYDVSVKSARPSKFLALLRKSYRVDFRFTMVPLIFVLSLVALVLCVCTYLFYFLFSSVFDMSVSALEYQLRWGDLGKQCFYGCVAGNEGADDLEKINVCFENRSPRMLFQKEPLANQTAPCRYYLSYLGLDYNNNFRAVLGDNANNMPDETLSYAFAVVQESSEDSLDYFETELTFGPKDYTYGPLNIDYGEIYFQQQKYDPLEHKPRDGLTPYIAMSQYFISNEPCGQMQYCVLNCMQRMKEHITCGESFNFTECETDCKQAYECEDASQRMRVVAKNARVYSSFESALDDYKTINLYSYTAYPDNMTEYSVMRVLESWMGEHNIHSILRVNEREDKTELLAAVPLPSVGRTVYHYNKNRASLKFNSTEKYVCNGQSEWQDVVYSMQNAKIQTPHADQMSYSMTYQQMPDRSHVRLFDIQNQPVTHLTGAVIRKRLFQNASTYEPWNFSYAYSTQEMPAFASSEVKQASVMSANDLLKSICALHFAVVAMFPMMHAAIQVGNEIEMLALNLYYLHGVSPTLFVFTQLVYEIIISCIPVVIDLVAAMILCPFLIFDSPEQVYNVIWFVLQSFLGMPTGMLMAILYRKGKPAAMTTFFIILVVLVFYMFQFSSKTFTIVVAIFIPAYILIYEQALVNSYQPIDWPLVGVCIAFTVLHILLCLFFVNFQLIKKKLQAKTYTKQLKEEAAPLLEDTDVTQDDTILQIQGVSHTYDGKLYALRDISFDIQRNHVFGLLGANGSGKSTLMHCLAGIYRPTTGVAVCNGVNLFERQTTTEMFSIVPQQDILFQNLTVLDHLSVFDYMSDGRGIEINKIIDIMSLRPFLQQPIFSLSGGVKRKLSFALTLCANPEIIALDEPSTGLGATTKKAVQEAVFALIETGKTVVLTSHDMEEVEMICDQCVILKDGKLVARGRVRQLRKDAESDFELQIQISDEQIVQLNSYFQSKGIAYKYKFNEICRFSSYEFPKSVFRQEIIMALQDVGMDGLPWIIEAMKLEKVFLQIVGQAGAQPAGQVDELR